MYTAKVEFTREVEKEATAFAVTLNEGERNFTFTDDEVFCWVSLRAESKELVASMVEQIAYAVRSEEDV
jgi:hypothetical protein